MKQVAIIGGGLAGLTCAYRLKQRAIEATVFETLSTPGGRCIVEQSHGFTIDAGAQYLLGPGLFRNTFTLIRELGLSDDILPIWPDVGQVYKGRIYHHRVASGKDVLKFKGLNILDKALLSRMVYLLARFQKYLDLHHSERGVDLDDESVAAFVKREFSQNVLNYAAGPLISTLFFYNSDETSKLLYLTLAKQMYDTNMSTLRGGIGRLSQRLSAGTALLTGHPVRSIAWNGSFYVIDGLQFSDVVVAVPGDAVTKIAGMNDLLSDSDLEFFLDSRYERVVTLVAGTPMPADGECYGVSIPRVEKLHASTISFHEFMDSSRAPSGCGLLAISGGGEAVSEEQLMGDLLRLYKIEPSFTKTYEWRSGMPKFPPGRYRQIAAFRNRTRKPGLIFCGDYLMGPFIEAAISSGLEAAEAIQQT